MIYEPEKPAEKVKAVATQTKSRLDALLSAIDESDLTAAEEAMQKLSVHDVPGGTVSFLFEKSSKLLVTSEVDEEAAES